MTLHHIKQTLQLTLPFLLDQGGDEKVVNGTTFMTFPQMQDIIIALNALETTNLFDEVIKPLKTSSSYNSPARALIDLGEGREFLRNLRALSMGAVALENVLKQIIPDEDPNSVYIKFPEIKDFDMLAKSAANFQIIFAQTILNDAIHGFLRIDSFENGSCWLRVFLGSPKAVLFVGSLAWSAAVVYKKIQEGRYIQTIVDERNIMNEHKKILAETFEHYEKVLLEMEATYLYQEYFSKEQSDHDQVSRIQHSLKILADEIGKGAEIQPLLTAPEEVKNLFPEMKSLPSIESRVKKIENK
jgi:hypothetical protein